MATLATYGHLSASGCLYISFCWQGKVNSYTWESVHLCSQHHRKSRWLRCSPHLGQSLGEKNEETDTICKFNIAMENHHL